MKNIFGTHSIKHDLPYKTQIIHYWHCCPLCEILIIAFVIETKIWTFHSKLLKSIIYYVALGGYWEKMYVNFEIKNK
jgi:hypothetical protein